MKWTTIALRLLDKAPDRIAVLREFVAQFTPMSWVGSRAAIVERCVKLLDNLNGYPDAAVAEIAAQEKVRLKEAIEEERRMEAITDRVRDERFE